MSDETNSESTPETKGSGKKEETNIPVNLKSNTNNKSLIKIFKVLGLLIAIGLIIFFSVVGYVYYTEKILPGKKMLSFGAADIEWEWYDEYDKIQINTSDFNLPMLRKVYLDEKYVIYAYKDKNYFLHASVNFFTNCKPNTEIKTSQKWSDGTHKKLKCDKNGNFLSYGVAWKGKDTDLTWKENLDGFNFKENFAYWNFTELDKLITLLNAK